MLTSNELKRFAHMRRLKHIDYIWKDYLQDLALHLLYKKLPNLIFRGGTSIWKTMNGNRFSEDIDLCAEHLPEGIIEYLRKELEFFGFVCSIKKEKRTANVLFSKLGIQSPAHPREIILSVEIVVSESCGKETKQATIYSPYPDIPPIEVIIPSREHMITDKISTIFQRDKARDVHDLYFLLKQGDEIKTKVSKKEFAEKLLEKKRLWKDLEPLIITQLPSFEEEMKYILSRFP